MNTVKQTQLSEAMENKSYYELEKDVPLNFKPPEKKCHNSRRIEKTVYVLATVSVIILTHVLTWAHCAAPFIYAIATPLLIGIKTIYYCGQKWHYFMLDFCYIVNTLTYVFLWVPADDNAFRVLFALTNGPIVVASAVYRNSLVYHNHDKLTSFYIHIVPPILTFCIRWFPKETSSHWFQPLMTETPEFDIVWLYYVPFAIFFLHSIVYFLIVNIVVKPTDPYVTSYEYLAEKFDKLNCIGGKWGQCIAYYGCNWIFCMGSLTVGLLAYSYFAAHCAILTIVFLIVVWNGGSYYVHVFSVRGFSSAD